MEDQDRQSRLQTASALLTLLKAHGGSARLAAAWLGVSPTTITNWHLIKEAATRKQGVPSDTHLRKLSTLAAWQIRQAVGLTRQFLLSELMRAREALVLTRTLARDYRALADDLESRADGFDKLLAELRDMAQKHGPGLLDFLLQPIEAHWGPEMPNPDAIPALPHVDSDALFREMEVTDDDIRAEDAKLQEFFTARNKKFIDQAVQRAQLKKRAKKK
jgi:hypothetical protein